MTLIPLPTGMVVLLAVAVVVAAITHWRVHRFWRATVMSALATVAVFFVLCLLQAGLPDPLEPRAIALFGGFGLLVATVMGVLVRAARASLPRRS